MKTSEKRSGGRVGTCKLIKKGDVKKGTFMHS